MSGILVCANSAYKSVKFHASLEDMINHQIFDSLDIVTAASSQKPSKREVTGWIMELLTFTTLASNSKK